LEVYAGGLQAERRFMSSNDDKTKFSVRVDKELLKRCDDYIAKTPKLSRTELIEDSLRFYLGFLNTKKAEDYLLYTLSSVLTSTVRDTENRLARLDFKVAVELSKLAHVIAYANEINEAVLDKLHLKCLEEVKQINGTINFEDAYRYQKSE